MGNVVVLLLCLVLGFVFRKYRLVPEDAHTVLNKLIIYVFIPAITLRYGLDLELSSDLLIPVASTWIVFAGSFIFFNILGKYYGFNKNTTGALIVTSGISSISFVGFPIFELMYGVEGLKTGIIMSQAGTFVVCSTVGILVASYYAQDTPNLNWGKLLKNNLTFPPFLAFCVVIILNTVDFYPPKMILDLLEKMAQPLSIIALFSIGLQMDFGGMGVEKTPFILGLFYKLVVAPLLIFVVFILILNRSDVPTKVSIIGSALGSMNTIGIIAINLGLNAKLIANLLAVSIPMSLITVSLIYYFLTIFY